MNEFFYPTQANEHREWFAEMLAAWSKSGKRYLCFPFIKFKPSTLTNGGFWMYMYYRQNDTDIESLKGKVKFRIHVTDWAASKFTGTMTHTQDFGGGETVWFLCDKAQQIANPHGQLLTINDFEHRDGKQLFSAIRSSIAPVVCKEKDLRVVKLYPVPPT